MTYMQHEPETIERKQASQSIGKAREKLNTLAADWGYDSPLDMLESIGLLASPAICMNDDCDYTTDIEPDNARGFCECCQTRTVASALLLAGYI